MNEKEVLEAMEHPAAKGPRFLPSKNGKISAEALASAERLGRLRRHIDVTLEQICHEIAVGNIKADPFWKSPKKNACTYCDHAAACQFEEGRGQDRRRVWKSMKTDQFWRAVERQTAKDEPLEEKSGEEGASWPST